MTFGQPKQMQMMNKPIATQIKWRKERKESVKVNSWPASDLRLLEEIQL